MSFSKGLVWVTGASKGIGRATAIHLSKLGWNVAASARDDKTLEQMAERFERVYSFPLDVGDPVARKDVYQRIREEHGPIDVLVNNAAFGFRGAVEDMEMAEMKNLFDINVFAPLALTKLVLPEMRSRQQGRIIMVSSVVGRVSMPLSGAYSASKFALEGFTDALRMELMPWGIKVVLVEPGPISTNFGKTAGDHSTFRMKNRDSAYLEQYKSISVRGMFAHRTYWGPSTVAVAIREAIEHPRPKARYPVHWSAHLLPFLRNIIPTHCMDKFLGFRMGFTKKHR